MLTMRKHRISRLEEFSDAVFGFALLGPRELAFLSPSSFVLMGPDQWAYARWADKQRNRFQAQLVKAEAPQAT